MSQPVLGTIPSENDLRDAVHIAVIPMIAGCVLFPSDKVRLDKKKKAHVVEDGGEYIGVVDPFLECPCILPGQRFWLCMKPQSVLNLRHAWTHKEFEAHAPVQKEKGS
jgi:hypothetical protein